MAVVYQCDLCETITEKEVSFVISLGPRTGRGTDRDLCESCFNEVASVLGLASTDNVFIRQPLRRPIATLSCGDFDESLVECDSPSPGECP